MVDTLFQQLRLNYGTEYIKRAETVETFKTRLKTYLFQKHYCQLIIYFLCFIF